MNRPMSGGHFDYNQSLISEIADTIAIEIARALLPKPQKVHEDYWTIYEHDCPCSYHNYCGYYEFKTYEEAESYLLSDKSIVPVEHNYGISHIPKEDRVFRSTKLLMGGTKDAEPIPWLYSIHHCIFDHYPYDADVLELNEETIETMKDGMKMSNSPNFFRTDANDSRMYEKLSRPHLNSRKELLYLSPARRHFCLNQLELTGVALADRDYVDEILWGVSAGLAYS